MYLYIYIDSEKERGKRGKRGGRDESEAHQWIKKYKRSQADVTNARFSYQSFDWYIAIRCWILDWMTGSCI